MQYLAAVRKQVLTDEEGHEWRTCSPTRHPYFGWSVPCL